VRVTLHRKLAEDLRQVRLHYFTEGGPNLRDRFNAEFDQVIETIINSPKRYHFISHHLRRGELARLPVSLALSRNR
jgi:hypothetical protein